MPVILLIQQAAELIQAGITSYRSMRNAVRQGKAQVTESDGTVIAAADLERRVTELLAHGARVGDGAAGRVTP